MTQPNSEQVSVATEVLRTEASQWQEQGDTLTTLSSGVAGMEFGRLEAGLFQMMVGPYNDVIHGVTARCTEGATAMAEKEVLQWFGVKSVEIGTAVLTWLRDLLKGATAPIWMFLDSYRWMEIRGTAKWRLHGSQHAEPRRG
jgi:hypothetical protein